jgi:hypothetical protein
MTLQPLRTAVAASLLAVAAIPALAVAEPGDMMHMTASIKIQVANAPVNIPAQAFNRDICVSKQHDVRDVVKQSQRNKACTVSGYKLSGMSGSFHYACSGAMQVAGDGSFTAKADGGSHVTISAAGNANGQAMQMNMTFDTTPAGATCDYTPPASP